MEYRPLGRSGCAVSSLCLGTMTFGTETDEPGAHRQLDRFVEAGGTLVDTADVYSGGMSQEILRRLLPSPPACVTQPGGLGPQSPLRPAHFPHGLADSAP